MSTTNILDLNNRIDELVTSYPAAQVMMSDGVTSVEEAVANYSFGSEVTLTKNTDYICPSDGYFQIYLPNSVQSYVYAYINGRLMMSVASRATSPVLYEAHFYDTVFVRKGTTIKFAGGTSSEAYFIPLT